MKNKIKKVFKILIPCIAFVILALSVVIEINHKTPEYNEFGDLNGLSALFMVMPTVYFLIGYAWIAFCKNERLKHIVLFVSVFPISYVFWLMWDAHYWYVPRYIVDLFSYHMYVLCLLLVATMLLVLVNALLFMPPTLKNKKI